MTIIIRSIKGLKFALKDKSIDGFAKGTGLGFFDTETNDWVSNYNYVDNYDEEFPYIPIGGRKALNIILESPSNFQFIYSKHRVKSI